MTGIREGKDLWKHRPLWRGSLDKWLTVHEQELLLLVTLSAIGIGSLITGIVIWLIF